MGAESISWDEIIEVVGQDAAQALGRRFGGVSLYVPANYARGKLAQVIGLEAAQALAARFGGSTLMLPNVVRKKEPKKTRIIELISAGWSTRRIAMKVKVTEDWVKMVRRQCRDNLNRGQITPKGA